MSVMSYVATSLGCHATFAHDLPWQQRMREFLNGNIDVCWMCSLPYFEVLENQTVQLLVAPAMQGTSFPGPVYQSHVLVRHSSKFRKFEDLRHQRIAYNEPLSLSGHGVLLRHLRDNALSEAFFSELVKTGSHQHSIELLLDGDIDAAVVDSSVLAVEIGHAPDIEIQLRKVLTLGPNPAPPLVVNSSIGEKLISDLRETLVSMNLTVAGQQILAATNFNAFSEVSEADYNSVKDLRTQMQTNSRYQDSVLELEIIC